MLFSFIVGLFTGILIGVLTMSFIQVNNFEKGENIKMKKCIGTDYDIEHCQVEKRGCEGCFYYREEEEINEQKVSEHTNSKSDKTD